jgi:hypothetical protein
MARRPRRSPLEVSARNPAATVPDERLPLLLTRNDVADVATARGLPTSPRSVERWSIPYLRVPGGAALYRRGDVLSFIAERLSGAVPQMGGSRPAPAEAA